jgi:CPA1 family monovalent cation:H+ antiporter
MTLFISILLILAGAALSGRLAAALSVPFPAFLALGGAIIAFLPGAPSIELDPSLALVIFVAPVLLDAAYDTSLRDLRDNRLPIIMLVVAAVGITAAATAIVFRALVPGVPWAAAVALGAIVAPPDAAAATAVLRQVKVPSRVATILEGESLFNDASALLIFAVALRLTQDGNASLASLIPAYAASVAGSAALGLILARIVPRLLRFVDDAQASIVLQFCTTFGIWILAETLHLSAILTVAAYGIAIAHPAPGLRRIAPLLRLKSFAVWDTAVFLANVLAFTLIGMQLAPLLARLDPGQRTGYLMTGAAILATVIAARIVWVMTYNSALRYKNWRFGTSLPERVQPPAVKGGVIIAWSGMRGIVSLAAALALPSDFPERDLIQFVAFAVVLGTLVVQGFTLGPLVQWLRLPEDRQLDREIALARRRALEAALGTLEGNASPHAAALRLEYQAILDLGEASGMGNLAQLTDHERLRIKAIQAARGALQEMRATGEIGDIAFQRIEAAIDRAYLYATRYKAAG